MTPRRGRGGAATVTAAPSETAPSQRDRHLQTIARHGRLAWQKQSGYAKRARTEAAMSRSKQCRATKVAVAVRALNRMSEPGRPNYVRLG